MNKQVYNTLKYLGVPPNVKGYNYLSDALTYMLDSSVPYGSFCNGLYVHIAHKYGVSNYKAVERCLRYIISYVLAHTDYEILFQVFGNSLSQGDTKMPVSLFLSLVAEHIKHS